MSLPYHSYHTGGITGDFSPRSHINYHGITAFPITESFCRTNLKSCTRLHTNERKTAHVSTNITADENEKCKIRITRVTLRKGSSLVVTIGVLAGHTAITLLLAETEVVIDKLQESVDVFVKMLDVVMSGTVDPEWLNCM